MPSSSNPTVSVIIPVYNVAPYIDECIQSVINQTYGNLEIIIIDDGSTDGSEKICDDFDGTDSRIRVFHQNNKGLGAARNKGLDSSSGEIISFLDSDDSFHPEMIEKLLGYMLENESDIAVCGFFSCEENGRMNDENSSKRFTPSECCLSSEEALKKLIQYDINFSVWNKLYKRTLFETIRFPEGRYYEDVCTTPYLIENAEKVTVISDNLVYYRIRKSSISNNINIESIKDRIQSFNELDDFISNRIPSIFTEEQRYYGREINLGRTISKYLNQRYSSSVRSYEAEKLLRDSILQYAQDIKHYSFKMKMKYLIFRISPGICYSIIRLKKHIQP